MHCKFKQLKLNGKYTKILKAFSDAHNLQHLVQLSNTNFGLGLEVSVNIKNKYMWSILDVFKHGQIVYVSHMREYTQNAQEDTIEQFSKKIVDGLYGEGRYIESIKGGSELGFIDGKWQFIKKFTLELPKTFEELLIQIDLAGIDWTKCQIELTKGVD